MDVTEVNLTKAAEVTLEISAEEGPLGAGPALQSFGIYRLWAALTGLDGPELADYIKSLEGSQKPVKAAVRPF